jgi:hypothetical protein
MQLATIFEQASHTTDADPWQARSSKGGTVKPSRRTT